MSIAPKPWAGAKAVRLLAVFILAMSIAAALPVLSPPNAQALPGPCDLIPSGIARKICQTAQGPSANLPKVPGLPSPTKIVGSAANAIVRPIINEFTNMEAAYMTSTLKSEAQFINRKTTVGLTEAWFKNLYLWLAAAALIIGFGLLIPRLHSTVKEGDIEGTAQGGLHFVVFMYAIPVLPLLVGGLVWFCDTKWAPFIMNNAFTNLNATLSQNNLDFTKAMSISNNALTPILEPFLAGVIGTIGSFFTWILLQARVIVLYALVVAEAFSMAMTVSNRWGNDAFVRTTMALLAWSMLKVVLAVLLFIGVMALNSPDTNAAFAGGVMLLLLPVLTWVFLKWLASHRVSLFSGFLNANRLWNVAPKFGFT